MMQTYLASVILLYPLPFKQRRNQSRVETALIEMHSVPTIPKSCISGNKQEHIDVDLKHFVLQGTVVVLMQVELKSEQQAEETSDSLTKD